MKLSEKWLRSWVKPDWDTQQLADRLTMAGLEIESITILPAEFTEVYVGKVIEAGQHPNADRLRVCQVIMAEGESPLTIVCGAPNVRAGLKVAVAQVGAVLPGDVQIKRAKIRDVESAGMICSASELGLPESSPGIMELPEDAPLGVAFAEYWQLPDQVIEVNITPNRGDCLSVLGIAREVSVLSRQALTLPDSSAEASLTGQIADKMLVKVTAEADCPRYVGRIVRHVNSQAVTPLWMQERLRRSGVRVIHPVVDISNYVMLELGQPLHAFDLAKISDEIVVRRSLQGERVKLLDGQELTLNDSELVIADAQKILALAGIMGGVESGVSSNTADIFLESAFFTPKIIRTTLRQHNLQSDAAYRYERGVDPDLAIRAIHRATELLVAITGGQAGPLTECVHSNHLPKVAPIFLHRARIPQLLGIEIADAEVEEILLRLAMPAQKEVEGWKVTPPSYRFDLQIEVDLVEEIARIYGYDVIPAKTLQGALTMLPAAEQNISSMRLRQFMMARGYHEAITYSFVDPNIARFIDPEALDLVLKNPISAEMSVMRTSLWPGLIQAAVYNLNRQVAHIRLFETGVCFRQESGQLRQETKLAAIAAGDFAPVQWGLKRRSVDFFDLKGDLECLLDLTGDRDSWEFTRISHPALHPGRAAKLVKNGKEIGILGELHPQLQQTLDLSVPLYVFEVNLADIALAQLPAYSQPSKYPSIRRDLAFIVAEQVVYQEIEDKIKAQAGEALQNVQIFDIYQGQGIQNGQRSVALSLTFQLASRTLIDQEVDQAIHQVIHALKQDLKAILRE